MSRAPIVAFLEFLTEKRVARFWSRVERRGPDECWPWRGRVTPLGYGVLEIEHRYRRVNMLAHRIAKTLALGRDLLNPHCRHLCNNRVCCNPAHLQDGTALDNHLDAVRAGTVKPSGIGGCVEGKYGVAHPASRYGAMERAEIVRLWQGGMSYRRIVEEVGCHRETVHRILWEAFPASFKMPASVRRMRKGVDIANSSRIE